MGQAHHPLSCALSLEIQVPLSGEEVEYSPSRYAAEKYACVFDPRQFGFAPERPAKLLAVTFDEGIVTAR